MMSEMQVKVLIGFDSKSYDVIPNSGYFTLNSSPIFMSLWSNGDLDYPKTDPIVGKIKYLVGFIYLEDMILTSLNDMKMIENGEHCFSGRNYKSVKWKIYVSEKLS